MEQHVPGLFGKVPTRGDFVSRRLSHSFIERWDAWLRESIATSRQQLGPSWLECYLTSPIWRFVLSARICGENAWAGVLMPSVDSVGRYFPLTIGSEVGSAQNPFEILARYDTWFTRMEGLARSCLEDDFDLQTWDEALEEVGAPEDSGSGSNRALMAQERTRAAQAWRLDVSSPRNIALADPELIRFLVERVFSRFSLWWSSGSEHIQPTLLICRNLPPSEGYAAMLDGGWSQWGWFESEVSSSPVEGGETQIRPKRDPAV